MSDKNENLRLARPVNSEDLATLATGDPLPEGTFAVYETGKDNPAFSSISRRAYPDADHMTILRDGEFVRTEVLPLFGARSPMSNHPRPRKTKERIIANVDGKVSINGHRMPFRIADLLLN